MSRTLLLIGTGGLIGSIGRYLTALFFARLFPSPFPYGTFAVNIIGCLIIGVVYGLSVRFSWLSPELRLFLTTGFCGGYTTFSSFAFENVQLLQNGNYLIFGIYSLTSFILCLLFAFLGITLSKI